MSLFIEEFKEIFFKHYGREGKVEPRLFFASGALNVMGLHTDYNGGYNLSMLLPLGLYVFMRPTPKERNIVLRSIDFEEQISVNIDQFQYDSSYAWANYAMGILSQWRLHQYQVMGCQLLFASTLPSYDLFGAKAAMQIVMIRAMAWLDKQYVDPVSIAELCLASQTKEHGLTCHPSDALTISLGISSSAILLHNQLQQHYPISLKWLEKSYTWLVLHDRGDHPENSKYNCREYRSLSQAIINKLQKNYSHIHQLSDLTMSSLNQQSFTLSQKEIDRAKYLIRENGRTLQMTQAIEQEEIMPIFQLMNESYHDFVRHYQLEEHRLNQVISILQPLSLMFGLRFVASGAESALAILISYEDLERLEMEINRFISRMKDPNIRYFLVENREQISPKI